MNNMKKKVFEEENNLKEKNDLKKKNFFLKKNNLDE
jgi:hypothetical protein